MNNLKDKLIAYLNENAMPFEEIKGQILFEYKGNNLVASDFENTIQISKVFVSCGEDLPTNADKNLIRKYLQMESKDFNESIISREITIDEKGHIILDDLQKTIEAISATDYSTTSDFLSAIGELAIVGVKFSLSVGASILKNIAKAIEPEE